MLKVDLGVETDRAVKSKFVSSKWETVDPEKLEKQAITTSKWDFFDENNQADIKNESLKKVAMYGSDDEDAEEKVKKVRTTTMMRI